MKSYFISWKKQFFSNTRAFAYITKAANVYQFIQVAIYCVRLYLLFLVAAKKTLKLTIVLFNKK